MVTIAREAVSEALRSLATAFFQITKSGASDRRSAVFRSSSSSILTQPGNQDIEVAYFAEQPGQPFQLALERSRHLSSTRSSSARSSLRSRREADRRRCTPSGSPRIASGSFAPIRESAVRIASATA